ncbi:protein kinase domain-containing protein [Actinokineospora cianjurensis]|uniref:non-specific serine/threonine protein kinase n=1 Tax=Actinokineospora cianjurensis TaxID=585224 RepID=A0A421AXL8_9PSEU|nr:protein kinase [Actinokineospora cianjurensis]RLK54570.1 serine/threonine protein kinase [Actinokineospora cianjurensis]
MTAAFGRYRVEGLLGRGGMGEVYRAYDPLNHRYVALKQLTRDLAHDPLGRVRFEREMRLLARIQSPHVVPVLDFGQVDGRLYLAMELLEGDDLDDVLDRGPLPVARAVDVVCQVAVALQAAHTAGLVHRDVKPGNIKLDGDHVYLLDFGIAVSTTGTTGLTKSGMFIGSVDYMAPERFGAGAASAQSDVYSLGCLLFECLTGHKPFPGKNLPAIISAHLTQDPPRPSTLAPQVPWALDEVVVKAMAKRPDDRMPSASAFIAAARTSLDTTTVEQPVEIAPAARRGWRVPLLSLGLGACAVLLALLIPSLSPIGIVKPSPTSLPSTTPPPSAPPTAEMAPPPAEWIRGTATITGCGGEFSTPNSTTPVLLSFENARADSVALVVYWVDFDGAQRFWFSLRPGDKVDQRTWAGHRWVIADRACLAVVIGPGKVVVS